MGASVSVGTAVDSMDRVYVVNSRETLETVDPVATVARVKVDERRRQPRRSSINEHGIHSARVRPGIDARLINVSSEGASIETTNRLLPGRRLILQLKFATCAVAVRGSVLRCTVFQASVDRITYRGALIFERRLHWIIDANGAASAVFD